MLLVPAELLTAYFASRSFLLKNDGVERLDGSGFHQPVVRRQAGLHAALTEELFFIPAILNRYLG
jgi:hypothetical protein